MAEQSISLESLQIFAFTDPASGKQPANKTEASKLARQAIVVIGADYYLRIFLLDAWAGRLPTSRYVDRLLKTHEKWQPRIFGVEANAMQSLFADTVRDVARQKLQRCNFQPVNQPTKIDKDFRIVTRLEPVISQGRLFFMQDQHEALSELRGHPTARTKDIIDALASAISLVPRRPVKAQRSSEADALAAYLRSTGAPPWQIEQRVQQMKEGSKWR